jgi:nanoRNase/pAp phosphatase (c-di-AMP/oligoRNAs hydrolase)
MTQELVGRLLDAVTGARRVLILPHNDPDPDAIASALALRYLLEQRLDIVASITYSGIIGRAENKALVHYLGRPLKQLSKADWKLVSHVALVDSQPGAGNNPLPAGQRPAIVLDHHVWREQTTLAIFHDVRPDAGSTSTILTEYLQAVGLEPPEPLATALFYGIKTDTMGLARGAGLADVAAYYYLQPLVDIDALIEIERAQVPAGYFKSFVTAFRAARVHGSFVLSYLGPMGYPDLAAEIADQLLRLEGIQWVLCMGVYNDNLNLAARTRSRKGGAGQFVRAIVGDLGIAGGHGSMAGGQVPLQGADPEELARSLSQLALRYLKIGPNTPGQPLI